MLKTLLCDLTKEQIEHYGLLARYDAIVGADDAAVSHACTGCLGCWTCTPGVCTVRDRLGDLGSLLGATGELHIASRCTYGGWSAPVKRILDRARGYVDPRFEIRDGQMHHRPRYSHQILERAWFYGPSTDSERTCARALAAANSLNRNSKLQSVHFPEGPQAIGEKADAPAEAAYSLVRQNPQLPRRIALINTNPRGNRATTKLILDDFADAFEVYAHHDVAPDALIPELVPFTWNHSQAFDPRCLSDCDSVILSYPVYCESLPSHVIDLLDTLTSGRILARGTRLYAIAHNELYESSQIVPSFQLLQNFCHCSDLTWSGGLAIGTGGMIPTTANMPRMGIIRRPLSEAIDKLILAVRCGTNTGMIEATSPVPRWIYRLASDAQWHSKAKRSGLQDLGARVTYQGQYATSR